MLQGIHVKLGPNKRENLDAYIRWMNDPEITQFLLMFRPITWEIEEEWYNNINKDRNEFFFTIYVKESSVPEKLIGSCSVAVDWKNRIGKMGIMIGEKDYWGKGYGSEAMSLMIKYSFQTLNLNRVELEVFDFNTRAKRSYQKVGLKEEGRRRSVYYINGKYTDAIMMGLLKEEWDLKNSPK